MVENQWLFAIGLGISGMLPRIFPLFALRDKKLSPEIVKWMSYIPVTIFSALVFSDIFFWNDQFIVNPIENLKLIPSLIVAFISVKMENLFLSMIIGIIAITLMVWGFAQTRGMEQKSQNIIKEENVHFHLGICTFSSFITFISKCM